MTVAQQVYHPGKNRIYERRFDYGAARARRAAGESLESIAADLGVSRTAVSRATNPRVRERMDTTARKWRTGTCEECGGPAMRIVTGKKQHNRDGRILCLQCRAKTRRERLRFDDKGTLVAVRCATVDCANGERWQPPENFPKGVPFKDVRPGGIHGMCRACNTRTRQRYREAHKVPCETCGAPCLPPSEKGRAGADRAMCRPCFESRAREREVVSAARETGR